MTLRSSIVHVFPRRSSPKVKNTNSAIMAASVVQWICLEMSRLLGMDATEDIAKYILSMDDRKELEEYMCELMDPSEPDNRKFIDQLLLKWRPPGLSGHISSNFDQVPDGVTVYQKPVDIDDKKYAVSTDKGSRSKKKGKPSQDGKSPRNSPRVQSPMTVLTKDKSPPHRDRIETDVKKKSKFVPLFTAEGEAKTVATLPGRHPCECQAAKHPLVSNCTKCGRIVCDQEGSGPCLFCGALVCTKEEQEILSRGSKKSDRLRSYLMSKDKENSEILPSAASRASDGLDKAMKHRDKLLDYDKNSVKRTQVIDDESDYFSTGSGTWLSNKEKDMLRKREEELRSKRHASRKDRKVTLDFAGRQVIDSKEVVDMYDVNDSVVQEVHFGIKTKTENKAISSADFYELVNPNIEQEPPKFDGTVWGKDRSIKKTNPSSSEPKTKRIQDREYQEMTDDGMALSMHQPYASLLVAGIKVHEGRSWYTAHRGRLWIAATAQKPEPKDIAELEQQYRIMYNDAELPFPNSYPVACLLGCVEVVDCLAQDEYRQKFPNGESGSPYVFVCENHQELVLKFPMKGKHKIYKLESHNHNAAKKGILRQTLSH